MSEARVDLAWDSKFNRFVHACRIRNPAIEVESISFDFEPKRERKLPSKVSLRVLTGDRVSHQNDVLPGEIAHVSDESFDQQSNDSSLHCRQKCSEHAGGCPHM